MTHPSLRRTRQEGPVYGTVWKEDSSWNDQARRTTLADRGFPTGGANLLFGQSSQKLHEKEEILGQRGRASLAPPPPHPNRRTRPVTTPKARSSLACPVSLEWPVRTRAVVGIPRNGNESSFLSFRNI